MDSDRFDAWTRRLAARRDRRATIGLLGAGALVAALPGAETRAGVCGLLGARCKKGGDCCSGRCRRRKGKKHGKCRCSRTEGTECVTAADCCQNKGFVCDAGECAFVLSSDRARKRDIAGVDPADMLARAAALPIATWSYMFDDPSIRHIGPMAQDFAALFGVGA
ncbi:MAG TPA: tail fiber domain-containing protein, partial [Thermomicrobiales bacterium]|nr:tail fiber domain-containing protein [Thermomicrobiales bacterium]